MKENHMTGNARSSSRILGSLRSEDGRGTVRVEDRFNTDIDDLWSALTEPSRLARWYAQVEGDLRPGGEFRMVVHGSGWEGTGRVQACEPPRRLAVTSRELQARFDGFLEATLTPDGDQTILVIQARGLPLEKVHFYGVGWQIHVEDLAAYIAGQERGDAETRWAELVPAYEALATDI
jgi:uncharacterized protein YndB with AHSA1/START domain